MDQISVDYTDPCWQAMNRSCGNAGGSPDDLEDSSAQRPAHHSSDVECILQMSGGNTDYRYFLQSLKWTRCSGCWRWKFIQHFVWSPKEFFCAGCCAFHGQPTIFKWAQCARCWRWKVIHSSLWSSSDFLCVDCLTFHCPLGWEECLWCWRWRYTGCFISEEKLCDNCHTLNEPAWYPNNRQRTVLYFQRGLNQHLTCIASYVLALQAERLAAYVAAPKQT